jgi:hypothetical protein
VRRVRARRRGGVTETSEQLPVAAPPRRSKGGVHVTYERPEVLATYSLAELVEEAAVCLNGYKTDDELPA